MNKLLVIYGCALLGSSPVAEPQESTVPVMHKSTAFTRTLENNFTAVEFDAEVVEETPLHVMGFKVERPIELRLDEIVFIEVDTEVDLGFDTFEYLPEDFNAHEVYFDVNAVEYIEADTEIDLGFDTSKYLPEDFNAYEGTFDLASINYVEEEEIDLGFDTVDYLPIGFDPYEVYFDVNSIEFIEETNELDLGFDTSKYLSEGFDPYVYPSDVTSINYIDLDKLNDDVDI